MERKNGFYWVKYNGVWQILEWDENRWLICGFSDDYYYENEQRDNCEQVDENRIINPNE